MDCCADFEEENEEGEKANVEQHMQLVDQHLSKAKMHYKALKMKLKLATKQLEDFKLRGEMESTKPSQPESHEEVECQEGDAVSSSSAKAQCKNDKSDVKKKDGDMKTSEESIPDSWFTNLHEELEFEDSESLLQWKP